MPEKAPRAAQKNPARNRRIKRTIRRNPSTAAQKAQKVEKPGVQRALREPIPDGQRAVWEDFDSYDSDDEPIEYPRFGIPELPGRRAPEKSSEPPPKVLIKSEPVDENEILTHFRPPPPPTPKEQQPLQNPRRAPEVRQPTPPAAEAPRERQPVTKVGGWQMELPPVPLPVGEILPDIVITNSRIVNCEIKDMVLVNCELVGCKIINSRHYRI